VTIPLESSSQESPLREALRLSWPATLSLILHSFYRVNDQYWIQDLGRDAQAALGMCSFVLILNFAFIQLLNSGILARIAFFTGAKNREAMKSVFGSGLKSGMILMVAVGVAGFFATPFLVRMLGASGNVAVLAESYLSRIYILLPLVVLKPVTDSVFIGLGNTVTPMFLSAFSVGLNFVLNPMLIYGVEGLGIPAMGVAGAAWATGISRGLGGVIALGILGRVWDLRLRIDTPVHWKEVRKMTRIGIPVALSTAAYAIGFIAVLKTSVEPLGPVVQAGLGIGFNGIESIAYCGLFGPAMAVSGMVGRRIGGGDPQSARISVRVCLGLSVGISLFFSFLFLTIPELMASIYSHVPEVTREVVLYLSIVAWSQPATAAESIFAKALGGAGRTAGVSAISIGGYFLRIPLAWGLAHGLGLGALGVWWALNLSNYLKLAVIVPLYRREMERLNTVQ